MILKCLRRTRKLERFTCNLDCDDDILEEICSLENLKELVFTETLSLVDDNELFLELPKSLRRLQLVYPSTELIRLLPEICGSLRRVEGKQSAASASQAGFLEDTPAENKSRTGLQSLALSVYSRVVPAAEMSTILESLAHSLRSTLIELTFNVAQPVETQALTSFLSALPLLRSLTLVITLPTHDFLDGLREHAFGHLCSLKLYCKEAQTLSHFPAFWQALSGFIHNCSRLDSLTLALTFYGAHRKPQVTEMLMHQLILATTEADAPSLCTRLRCLELKSIGIPLESFEYLCRSAPLLNRLQIALPSNHFSRIGRALGQLSCLRSLHLENTNFDLYDGDATKLVESVPSSLVDFFVGSTQYEIDYVASKSSTSHHRRLRMKTPECDD